MPPVPSAAPATTASGIASLLASPWRHRSLVRVMAAREFAARYAGTAAGIGWALIQPLALVLTYWFVFDLGLRVRGPEGAPFIVWFLAGFLPWSLFSETVTASVASITAQRVLVTKLVFPVEVLPVVQLVVAALAHAVIFAVTLGVAAWHGYPPRLVVLGALPYLFGVAALALGVGWALAVLNVFFRDLAQVVALALQVAFWLTPIVWSSDALPDNLRWIPRANPMTCAVEGYRRALLDGGSAGPDPAREALFFALALAALVVGAAVFRRLRPQLADVL